MKKAIYLAVAVLPLVAAAGKPAAVFNCYNDGALRVTCRGTFRDGESAAAFIVRVYDQNGELLLTERVSPYGRFTFRKPDADFRIVFEETDGDLVTIVGRDVT
jgi:hypothetical protein